MARVGAILVVAIVVASATADPPAEAWKMESLRLHSGAVFTGLVLEENDRQVRFVSIRRTPGRPTFCLWTTFPRNEIATLARLPSDERAKLAARLKALQAELDNENARLAALDVERSSPLSDWHYQSDRFSLESDADEAIVRRSALRLEQIFAAYARYFPSRIASAKPTRVVLVEGRARYDAILRTEGWRFSNAAFFDPATRRVVACADLGRLGADLKRTDEHHKLLRADLVTQERLVARLYKGNEQQRHLQPIRDARARIAQAEQQNETLFADTTHKLFAALYHEAFHSYFDASVFPSETGDIPRWLNEGLAQLFESALVEAGEMRVGHADAEKLEMAKQQLRLGKLIPLRDLLRSSASQFQTNSPEERRSTANHYVAAWAWAHYLVFGRRILTNPALAEYVKELRAEADPWHAFSRLVRCDPALLERDFHNYVERLQPDGSLRELAAPNRP